MTFYQALAYFTAEAAKNLFRSWKVSLLAIMTIAVSLFLTGVFLLLGGNLRQIVENWYEEGRIAIYLEHEVSEAELAELQGILADAVWTTDVQAVSGDAARRRFSESFPSLEDLLEGWSENPLPTSLEVSLDWSLVEESEFELWLSDLRARPRIEMVDDDRDWLGQIRAISYVIDGLGMILGAILLLTAVFTISSVIRLTAYLYRDEISVMRLVGATEFFIRGPFYMEGLLQGLCGGILAVSTLMAGQALLLRNTTGTFWTTIAGKFLGPGQFLTLIALGGLAGLIGALVSLRKEDLGANAELSVEQ